MLIDTLKERQGDMSYDDFARLIQIKTHSLRSFIVGDRNMGIANVRKIATWARQVEDAELIEALIDYALCGQKNAQMGEE